MQNAVKKLLGNDIVDEAAIKEFVRDLQRALIQADVNVKLVLSVTEGVQKRALEEKPPPGLDRKNQIVKILYEELDKLLGGDQELKLDRTKLTTVVMLGIQGSGKTTTVGKLARFYVKKGFKVGVVAADTFRPGAVTQLKTIAQVVGVDVYSDEKEKDSVKVAEAGKRFFEESGKNLIVIDTAGRHKEEQSLLDEMSKIYSKVKPDLNLLVVDGTIGQQAFNQAAAFHKASPVGGIVVTKLDGAAKGGGALAAVGATGAKVFFIGSGERVDDLEEFSATRFVGRLLGMGDLKALLDMARQVEGEVDEKRVQRIVTGRLTMDDFLFQFEQVNKMGSLKKILDLIPGVSGNMKSEDLEKAEKNMKTWKSIIQAMTSEERAAPEKLNAPRVKRIAQGSGRSEKDVRELIARYRQTKSMMKSGKGREMRQFLRRAGGQAQGG
ncbi:MAG TPA: signal recognition particle receptor subunit alpha [Nitrososphaerales archaeon]|nr:signal recognition particle receptor subunit alpha [Nitrososphaerales archaeon]